MSPFELRRGRDGSYQEVFSINARDCKCILTSEKGKAGDNLKSATIFQPRDCSSASSTSTGNLPDSRRLIGPCSNFPAIRNALNAPAKTPAMKIKKLAHIPPMLPASTTSAEAEVSPVVVDSQMSRKIVASANRLCVLKVSSDDSAMVKASSR